MVGRSNRETESEAKMNGTHPKCPNKVSKVFACLISQGSGEGISQLMTCGYEHYQIVDPHPFSEDSGLDSLGVKVKCMSCGCEYYVFPALN